MVDLWLDGVCLWRIPLGEERAEGNQAGLTGFLRINRILFVLVPTL
jgi:hypothetical protein